MADFFDDPDYPDRPQHPDYWRMVNAVNYFDGQASESPQSMDEVLASTVDPPSITYMALQRALRVSNETGLPQGPLAAVWIDAFICGTRFQQDGGHQDTPTT